jgi:hypothetical protein
LLPAPAGKPTENTKNQEKKDDETEINAGGNSSSHGRHLEDKNDESSKAWG